MPEKALELLRSCPYLEGLKYPEAGIDEALIRFTGGSVYRKLDGGTYWRLEAEIELNENAEAACAGLNADLPGLIELAPPHLRFDGDRMYYVIKLTFDVKEG